MVSTSFTTLLIVALVAISQVVVAAPSYPAPCKEIHPKEGAKRTWVEPYFNRGKEGKVILSQKVASDGTKVQVKHLFENDGTILLIKTKDAQHNRIAIGSRISGNEQTKRYFKLKKNHVCYVPTQTKEEAENLNFASYYVRN
jgi:hypothetical protein